MDVALRAQPHDPEALYRLFRSAMEPHVVAARGEPWNDERERAQFFEQLAPASVRVIVLKEQVVGFVDLRAFDVQCVVHTMVVAPQWQSSGVGGAVIEQLRAKWSRMSLSVLKTNTRARRFYERAGFREVGSTERHHQMAWASERESDAPAGLSIRQYQEGDEAQVVGVWHRSGRARYTFLPTWQQFSLEMARNVFGEVIRPNCQIWVGVRGDRIVAYLAMNGSQIARMYVDPNEWRKGWGTRLLELAKKLSPEGLELYTHQQNASARAFYEEHGFIAVKFGISPPPERAPDVEYHWRPARRVSS